MLKKRPSPHPTVQRGRESGGHPQTPGKGALPLCTPRIPQLDFNDIPIRVCDAGERHPGRMFAALEDYASGALDLA